MTMRTLIKSLFEYLTVWIKDYSQETKQSTSKTAYALFNGFSPFVSWANNKRSQ